LCYIFLVVNFLLFIFYFFFFSSRRRHTRSKRDWSSDVCSSDLPISLCVIARPLNRMEAFTLSPFLRNLRPFRSFVLKSCSSIVGLKRTSFKLMTFCFLRASFSLFCCSKRYFP